MKTLINDDYSKDYLYHYTTDSKLCEYIAISKTLKFSSISNTNDPKEKFLPNVKINYKKKYFNNQFQTIVQINELAYKIMQDYKLLCFCQADEKNDSKGYDKPRMWAQYANDHKGCCIVLNKNKFEETLKHLKSVQKISDFEHKTVKYCNIKIPEFDFNPPEMRWGAQKWSNLNPEIKVYIKNNIDYFLFTKNQDWKNENEYRYLIFNDNNNDIFVSIENSIEGIIFGYNFPKLMLEKMIEVFDDTSIKTTQLIWENGYPKITKVWDSFYNYQVDKLKEKFHNFLFQFSLFNDIEFNSYQDIENKHYNIPDKIKKDIYGIHIKLLNFDKKKINNFEVSNIENKIKKIKEFLGK